MCSIANQSINAPIIYRVSSSRSSYPDEAGLDHLHIDVEMHDNLSELSFEPVQTPLGVFNLHVAYRLECDFTIYNVNEIPKELSLSLIIKPEHKSTENLTFLTESSPDKHQFRVNTLPRASESKELPSPFGPFTPQSVPASLPNHEIMRTESPLFLAKSLNRKISLQGNLEIELPFANMTHTPPFPPPILGTVSIYNKVITGEKPNTWAVLYFSRTIWIKPNSQRSN